MSVNSKMTVLANEIRELSGTTDAMGLDDMATHVSEANENVDTEASLISQIAAALEGKAVGGGSGSGIEYEIITIPAGATSATYTLSRVTAAYGCLTAMLSDRFANDEYHRVAVGVWNNVLRCITYVSYDYKYGVEIELSSNSIDFNNGTINFYGATFLEPMNILLINDPNEPWAFG